MLMFNGTLYTAPGQPFISILAKYPEQTWCESCNSQHGQAFVTRVMDPACLFNGQVSKQAPPATSESLADYILYACTCLEGMIPLLTDGVVLG